MKYERFLVPGAHLLAISGLAFTLIVIVVIRGPYTHGNLSPDGYDRTEVTLLGQEYPYDGVGLADPQLATTGTAAANGEFIFFSFGCASCHGLDGEGGVVGPTLETDLSASKLRREVRDGPAGMPAFSEELVTDEALANVLAFIQSR